MSPLKSHPRYRRDLSVGEFCHVRSRLKTPTVMHELRISFRTRSQCTKGNTRIPRPVRNKFVLENIKLTLESDMFDDLGNFPLETA